jgi:hypothetical protein
MDVQHLATVVPPLAGLAHKLNFPLGKSSVHGPRIEFTKWRQIASFFVTSFGACPDKLFFITFFGVFRL